MSYTKEQIALQTFAKNGLVSPRNMSFAMSIATCRNASSNQLFYVNKMVQEILAREQAQIANAALPKQFDEDRLFLLFDNARSSKLKFPKIRLQFTDGSKLQFAMSQKYPDTIWISQGGYGTPNYGRINRGDGKIIIGRDIGNREAELLVIVKDFAADPETVAANYGKLTHNCCFCHIQLDTAESLAVGYGPVCAKNYKLAWGKNVPQMTPTVHDLAQASFIRNA